MSEREKQTKKGYLLSERVKKKKKKEEGRDTVVLKGLLCPSGFSSNGH